MKNAIRNLFFLMLLVFSISYDSCTSGVAYDKKYKLSPEVDEGDCVVYFTERYEYGNRWYRLGEVTFFLGIGMMWALFLLCENRRPVIERNLITIAGRVK